MNRAPLGAAGDHACGIYTGALDELVRMYSNRPHTVTHAMCTVRGDAHCEWIVE
jgi:predicted hydrocarbon binding protein